MRAIELSVPPYLDDLRADLRAFVAFFAPVLREVDFFALDFVVRDFVDFLVAGDFAICRYPFVPL